MGSHFVMPFVMLLVIVVLLQPVFGENTGLIIGAAGALVAAFLVLKQVGERRNRPD